MWLLLCLSVDRLLHLCFPYRASEFCNAFAARLVVLLILIGLLVTSVHALWLYELDNNGCFIAVEAPSPLPRFVDTWTWASNVLYFFLPASLLLVVTACLSVSLFLTRRQQIFPNRPRSGRQHVRPTAVDDLALPTAVTCITFLVFSSPKLAIDALDMCFPNLWLHAGLVGEMCEVRLAADTVYVADHALLGATLALFSKAVRRAVGKVFRGRSHGVTAYSAANQPERLQLDVGLEEGGEPDKKEERLFQPEGLAA